MKQQNLFLTCAISALVLLMPFSYLSADTIYYEDQTLHLAFALDPLTHEAFLGTGFVDDETAYAPPPFGDPWWSSGQPNLWGHIVVPENITYNNEMYTVVGISQYAFYKATQTYSIQLPNTIRSIGRYAFCWAVNLEQINLPSGITSIPTNAFCYCKSLQSITFPSSITNIGNYAFFECRRLKELTIPSNCRSIGDEAFTWCDSITTLIIEDGTAPLSFGYAHDLALEYIPGIYYIKGFYRGQFADSPLEYIYLGRNIQKTTSEWGDLYSPFEKCYASIQSETTQFITHDGKWFKQVEFGPMVTHIPEYLFTKCTVIEDIELPPNIQVIKSFPTFAYGSTQKTLDIPETCDSLCLFVLFDNIYKLSKIICHKAIPPYVSGSRPNDNLVIDVPSGSGEAYRNHETWGKLMIVDPSDTLVSINVKYPGSLYGRLVYEDLDVTQIYRLKLTGSLNASDWAVVNTMTRLYDLDLSELAEGPEASDVSLTCHLIYYREANTRNELTYSELRHVNLSDTFLVPPTCTIIRGNAFKGQLVKHLIIPGPTIVESCAFPCDSLESLDVIGVGVQIMSNAFANANMLKSVHIQKGTIVNNNAFDSSVEEVILEDSIPYLGDKAFGNSHLRKVVIGGHVGYFGSNIFVSSQNSLDSLCINRLSEWCKLNFETIKDNPISIASHVIIQGNEIDSLCIPTDIQTLPKYTFAGYKGLKKVLFIGKKDSIGDGAFYGCNNLENVVFNDSVSLLGYSTFNNCKKLQSVSFNQEGLLEIPDSCFYGAEQLKSVKLAQGLRQINKLAFCECTSLPTIVFPPTIERIKRSAFQGCSAMASLDIPSSIVEIADNAFLDCANLKTLRAYWLDPIEINANIFNGISKRCILWVPFNTVEKYYLTGWGHIPLIEEGFYLLTVDPGINGTIVSADFKARSTRNTLLIDMEHVPDSVILTISPDSSYYLSALVYDSVNLASLITLKNNIICLSNIQDNHRLLASFEKFELGDVNADDYVDIGDIVSIVNNIQNRPMTKFIPKAADVNQDLEIDVGDIVGTVNIIYEDANNTAKAPRRLKQHLTTCDIWIDDTICTSSSNEVIVPVYLRSDIDISGFQMQLTIPENVSVDRDSQVNFGLNPNDDRLGAMDIYDVVNLSNNHYQILCASTRNNQFIGYDKDSLFAITLTFDDLVNIAEVELNLNDIRIADANGHVFHFSLHKQLYIKKNNITTNTWHPNEKQKAQKIIQDGEFFILRNDKKYTLLGTIY